MSKKEDELLNTIVFSLENQFTQRKSVDIHLTMLRDS